RGSGRRRLSRGPRILGATAACNCCADARPSTSLCKGRCRSLKSFVAEDERLSANVPDAPAPSGGFTLSDDEFITGTSKDVAQNIIEQCRAVGPGIFSRCSTGAHRSTKSPRLRNCSATKLFPYCGRRK